MIIYLSDLPYKMILDFMTQLLSTVIISLTKHVWEHTGKLLWNLGLEPLLIQVYSFISHKQKHIIQPSPHK